MTAALAIREDVPLGEVRDRKALPPERECSVCERDLMRAPHAPECSVRADIFRMNVTRDPRLERHEDLLQACTRRAFSAWLASGRPL